MTPETTARTKRRKVSGKESPDMVEVIGVRTFPRIHMTLIDVAGATRRRFGGAGFALQARPVKVRAARAARHRLDISPNLLDPRSEGSQEVT